MIMVDFNDDYDGWLLKMIVMVDFNDDYDDGF